MARLSRVRHLSDSDWTALLSAWVMLWLVRLGLWALPFSRLRAVIATLPGTRRGGAGEDEDVERLAWAVRVAGRYVPAATCLPQALTLHALLIRKGIPADVRIGFARDAEGTLQGHAWVIHDGKMLIGGETDLFGEHEGVRMPALIAARRTREVGRG